MAANHDRYRHQLEDELVEIAEERTRLAERERAIKRVLSVVAPLCRAGASRRERTPENLDGVPADMATMSISERIRAVMARADGAIWNLDDIQRATFVANRQSLRSALDRMVHSGKLHESNQGWRRSKP